MYVLYYCPHTVTSKPLDKPSDEFEETLGESVCSHNMALNNTTSLVFRVNLTVAIAVAVAVAVAVDVS